jgi:hypothetical protein
MHLLATGVGELCSETKATRTGVVTQTYLEPIPTASEHHPNAFVVGHHSHDVFIIEKLQRSITEILIRSLAVHILTAVSFGHFGSLMNLPTPQHIHGVVWFLFYSTIICGYLVIENITPGRYRVNHEAADQLGATFRFYSSGIPRMHVLKILYDQFPLPAGPMKYIPEWTKTRLVHLCHVDAQKLDSTPSKFDCKRIGGISACLAIVAQAVSTLVLCVRRLLHGWDSPIFDMCNPLAAFSSIIVSMCSLLVLTFGLSWRLKRKLRLHQHHHYID